MVKWNRVTDVGKNRTEERATSLSCYYSSPIAQAQPSKFSDLVDEKNFSFFRYVSNREYTRDNDWVSKDGYFREMFRSLAFAKTATSANERGQVSPTSSPIKQKNRLGNRPTSNKIIMLDLDETLIRAEPYIFGKTYNDIISVKVAEDQNQSFGVMVRPFTEEFLEIISRNHRLIVYTASVQEYAEKVVQVLDPKGKYIEQILHRGHCTFLNGMFVKNLNVASQYGVMLDDVIIIDNYVHSYALHPEHGIPIKPYYGAKEDKELVDLANFLHLTTDYPNLQEFMKTRFDFPKLYNFLESNSNVLSF